MLGVRSIICPYCGTKHVPELSRTRQEWSMHYQSHVTASLGVCPDCTRYYVVVEGEGGVVDWQPRALPRAVALEGVPTAIANDFHEAQVARGYGLHKAAVMLFRRAVQSVAVDLMAPEMKLEKQIDWLAQQQKISEDMRLAAHEVRHFGNAGAHPRDDGLQDVDAEDGELAYAFTRSLLERVYTEPQRVRHAMEKRAASRTGRDRTHASAGREA
jgi:hypothetical protein